MLGQPRQRSGAMNVVDYAMHRNATLSPFAGDCSAVTQLHFLAVHRDADREPNARQDEITADKITNLYNLHFEITGL
jgi:hypothetical protein